MHKKIERALGYISDAHIAEAAQAKKKYHPYWLGAVAAVLALVILFTSVGAPTTVQAAGLIAAPEYPQMAAFPLEEDFTDANGELDWESYLEAYNTWQNDLSAQREPHDGYADNLQAYFQESIPVLLKDGSKNTVCSPLNIYMALAMLAEVTGGSSRQQILDLLGADSIEAAREQAGQVWNAHYLDDGVSASILGNSLWLDESLHYNNSTVQALASDYYASVYQGVLGSEAVNESLRGWLDEQTGGLLKDQIQHVSLPADAVLALASTIYYRAKWSSEFYEGNNTEDLFYTPAGNRTVTYMNKALSYGPYYWGEDFGAVSLRLDDGSRMWLILPDEGKSVADVLESGEAMELVLGGRSGYQKQKRMKINLSLPKFDITADGKINDQLKALGITDVFDDNAADFSAILPEDDAYLSTVRHAARVKIDEKGVEAAAYTLMIVDATEAPVQTEEINFILNRPFVFVITSADDLPLFAGVVKEP